MVRFRCFVCQGIDYVKIVSFIVVKCRCYDGVIGLTVLVFWQCQDCDA